MSYQKGFTLIEMVISIGILSILAIFAIAALNPLEQFQKARDAQRKSDLGQMQRVLEQYYQDHGSYPAANGSYQIVDFNATPIIWGGTSGWAPYMNLVPKDPDTNRTYIYVATGSKPQAYLLYGSFERGPSDPLTCKATVANCKNNPSSVSFCTCDNVPISVDCGINGKHYPCNFGVSSPNTSP